MIAFKFEGCFTKKNFFSLKFTNTDSSIQAHRHPGHTLAAERALCVDAVSVHTHAWGLALIDVCNQTQI